MASLTRHLRNFCISIHRTSFRNIHTNEGRFCALSDIKLDKKDNENEGRKSESTKEKILEASLKFIHDHGWTHQTIGYGAETLGLPSVVHGMFPNGGVELLYYVYLKNNNQLRSILQQGSRENMKLFDFLHFAIKERLIMNKPYLSHWPQALALLAMPKNIPRSAECMLDLADDICYYAGDRSVDFNWYSRRIAVLGIYQSTELYMLQDNSHNNQSTWKFLSRRIEDIESVKENIDGTSKIFDKTAINMNAAFVTARNVLNLN